MKTTEILSFLLFISGYALGRIDSILSFFRKEKKCDSFVDKVKHEEKKERSRQKLLINDSKFVTRISTETLHKSADLGVKTEVSDNIENETAKLNKLKKKKD